MDEGSVKRNAVFLLIVIAAALVLRFWASHEAESMVGPLSLRSGPQGNVYAIVDDKLYVHSPAGDLLSIVPMERYGLSGYIDDFWVFGNGDILFRRELSRTPALLRVLEALRRGGGRVLDSAAANRYALQRCSPDTFACADLEHGGDILNDIGILRLSVDEQRDNLYVSDNFGHEVLLLDLQGKLQRRSGRMFAFPNHLSLGDDGLLYVADAEKHRIVAVKADRDGFGIFSREFRVVNDRPGRVYPVTLAQTALGEWWVVSAGITMKHGSLLIFSREGALRRTVELSGEADPYAILPLPDRVLVSDPTLMQIYAFGLDGGLMGEFGSPELQSDLRALAVLRRQHAAASGMALMVLVGVLVLALVLARMHASAGKTAPVAHRGAMLSLRDEGPEGTGSNTYDYHSVTRMVKVLSAVTGPLMAIVMLLLFVGPMADRLPPVFTLALFSTAIAAASTLFVVYLQMRETSIEINEDGIVFTAWRKKVSSPWQAVREIKAVTRLNYKIITDHGSIPIGGVEPADGPDQGWFASLGRERERHLRELIEEIKVRAPHAKLSASIFARPL